MIGLGMVQKQSMKMSFVESMVSTAIGFATSFAGNVIIFHVMDKHISNTENFWVTVFFTVLSLTRSFLVRRWFNARHSKADIDESYRETGI